ncbi:MAG: N(G),N(G)-dimethylarginine dimethylaminohydrolase [Candidatus Lokiarchaeota archaeon]|nr:N(G),N(G)-dimethylarginine dimethylaminohydrolase [Candidatus Lokiarchaeota archaeon]
MFKQAIVRKPCKNFQFGISTSKLGKPNYQRVLLQHSKYIEALRKCNLSVMELKEDDRFPDSTFVEDTAVVDNKFAVITNLGAKSRQGEEIEISDKLKVYYNNIESIRKPGMLEGGDVMKVEGHYYIGLSNRTNLEGANQLSRILKRYGYSSSTIPLKKVLHLKTGISYLGDGVLLVSGEFKDRSDFRECNLIEVQESEAYATNSLRINEYVLIPKGYANLKKQLLNFNFKVLELEMSEFEKMDGGLSCLSLRF